MGIDMSAFLLALYILFPVYVLESMNAYFDEQPYEYNMLLEDPEEIERPINPVPPNTPCDSEDEDFGSFEFIR